MSEPIETPRPPDLRSEGAGPSNQTPVLSRGHAEHGTGPPDNEHGGLPKAGGTLRRHPVLWTLAAIALVLIVLAAGAFIWARRQINPGGRPGALVTVDIPRGASTAKVGDVLAAAGVIHSGTLFHYYVKLEGDGPLYPGTYQLRKNSSYGAVIGVLSKPPAVLTDRLTIPEGFTMTQIAQSVAALPRLHLSAQKFLAAASSGEVRSPYEPPGLNNLEGLVFPDTYEVKAGESEVDVLEMMVGEFNDQAQQLGLAQKAQAKGMTPYQLVTVASLVEREAKLAVDRGPVASVIYNRLRANIPLQVDATQVYWLRRINPNVQLNRFVLLQPSPYNTYTNMGLPPTPIANPGLPSLEAAISPTPTFYLYYVTVNPQGKMGYASTSAGFNQLVAQCRQAHLC